MSAKKTAPTTIRLSRTTEELAAAEARRTRRSKSAILQAAADEGLRMRSFPGIGFRGADSRRRPWVIGSGLDVWEIIAAYGDLGESVDALVEQTDLDERAARTALAYYERFKDEIDEAMAENQRVGEELKLRFPTFEASA